jgi:hypothetical protein
MFGKINQLLYSRVVKRIVCVMAYIFGVTPFRPEVGGVVKLAVLSFTY